MHRAVQRLGASRFARTGMRTTSPAGSAHRISANPHDRGSTLHDESISDGKMKTATPRNIDEYITAFPPSVQVILQRMRAIVRQAAPDAEEALKYRMPTFVLNGNLVHFAAFENHIGFYPTPSAIEAFRGDLVGFQWAKGSVQFPLKRPIPFALIKRMVRFRVNEAREKMAARQRRK